MTGMMNQMIHLILTHIKIICIHITRIMAMEIVVNEVLVSREVLQANQMAEMTVTKIHITHAEAMDRVDALSIIIIIGTEVTLYQQLYTHGITLWV